MSETMIYGAVLAAILVLFFLSRGEELPEELLEAEGNFQKIRRTFNRAAVFLARRWYRRGGQTAQVRKAVYRVRSVLIFTMAAALLALLVAGSGQGQSLLENGRTIPRDAYGGSGKDLTVTALPEKNPGDGRGENGEGYGTFELHVAPREYTAEETKALAAEAMEGLPAVLAGGNPDLEHVSGKLSFVSTLEGYPFRITWMSEDYRLIDAAGEVQTAGLPEEGQKTAVTARLTYRDRQYERRYPVVLRPAGESSAARRTRLIREAIVQADETQAEEPALTLPDEIEGERIVWQQQEENTAMLLFLLIVGAGFVSWIVSDRQQEKEQEARRRRLQLAYPRLVNRLVLYLGAGMSVRNIFRRLDQGSGERELQKEITRVCRELDTGMTEAEVYGRFGQRCGLRSYNRLAALLIQNLRKGNRELVRVLQEEAAGAEEERKLLARQLGEEAGTRLLLPMILMLAVTMVVIIIPAFLGFS